MNQLKYTIRLALAAFWAMMPLTGCQPALTPEANPDPLILTLQMTPALDRLRPVMHACAAEENIGLAITSLPASALDPLSSGLALRWGAPDPNAFYAAVLGQEALVFIANPDNPLTTLNADTLREIYSGARTTWPGLDGSSEGSREVHPWAYPPGDDVEAVFEAAFLSGSSPGSLPDQLPVYLAPDPAAMLDAVAQDEDALGFLPAGWVDERIRVLTIPGLADFRINQPVLALSPAEPQQPARGWLLCLQENEWQSN